MDRILFADILNSLKTQPAEMSELERCSNIIYGNADNKEQFFIVQLSELMEFGIEMTNWLRHRDSNTNSRIAILEEMADVMIVINTMKHALNISDEDLRKAVSIKTVKYLAENNQTKIYNPALHGEGLAETYEIYKQKSCINEQNVL